MKRGRPVAVKNPLELERVGFVLKSPIAAPEPVVRKKPAILKEEGKEESEKLFIPRKPGLEIMVVREAPSAKPKTKGKSTIKKLKTIETEKECCVL